MWKQSITRRWNADPPRGEAIEAIFDRVKQGLETLRHDYPGQTVVLAAHGFAAAVIRAMLLDLSWEAFFLYAMRSGEVERYTLVTETL